MLVDEVDLGGGFGVAYLPGEVPLDPGRIAKDVAATVDEACAELGTPVPRVSIEPGRAIVGPDHAHPLHGGHRQAGDARRRPRCAPTSRSTAG